MTDQTSLYFPLAVCSCHGIGAEVRKTRARTKRGMFLNALTTTSPGLCIGMRVLHLVTWLFLLKFRRVFYPFPGHEEASGRDGIAHASGVWSFGWYVLLCPGLDWVGRVPVATLRVNGWRMCARVARSKSKCHRHRPVLQRLYPCGAGYS